MTKMEYEKTVQKLEEKEGKLYSILELARMTGKTKATIHRYLSKNSVKTFKLPFYRTDHEVILIPKDEALKIFIDLSSVLTVLKGLKEFHLSNDENIDVLIDLLKRAKGD